MGHAASNEVRTTPASPVDGADDRVGAECRRTESSRWRASIEMTTCATGRFQYEEEHVQRSVGAEDNARESATTPFAPRSVAGGVAERLGEFHAADRSCARPAPGAPGWGLDYAGHGDPRRSRGPGPRPSSSRMPARNSRSSTRPDCLAVDLREDRDAAEVRDPRRAQGRRRGPPHTEGTACSPTRARREPASTSGSDIDIRRRAPRARSGWSERPARRSRDHQHGIALEHHPGARRAGRAGASGSRGGRGRKCPAREPPSSGHRGRRNDVTPSRGSTRRPPGAPARAALSTRRMIFPERVSAGASTKLTFSGRWARGHCATWVFTSSSSSGLGLKLGRSRQQQIACPLTSCGSPMTAASATAGCETSALDLGGAEPVARDLDHVVGPADDPEVPVRSRLAESPAWYLPGYFDQYCLHVAVRVPVDGPPSRATASRGRGSPPRRPGPTPASSTISASSPKNGRGRAGLERNGCGTGVIRNMPVSVCHQVSMIGQRPLPMTRWYHLHASGLIGSPTEPSRRSVERSWRLGHDSPKRMRPRMAVAPCRGS